MNLTIFQLFLLRSSYQTIPKIYQSGIDFPLLTKLHNLNISKSRFSYFSSEIINIPLNSANVFISNSVFDRFLSPSLTISSKSVEYNKKKFNERIEFPSSTTKIKFKDCTWSNFLSSSDKGGCFGILSVSEAKITGCTFMNIIIYTKYTTGKGAFMIVTDFSSKSCEFKFKRNIMYNITSINLKNSSTYHAFYVINSGSSEFTTNSMALLSKGGLYSCLLRSLSSTEISRSNFTHSSCKIGSGFNAEFFDKSTTKIRYSLFSKLGGLELLRLSFADDTFCDTYQYAKVTVEYVNFIGNYGSLLITLNNNIDLMNGYHFISPIGIAIRFSMASSQFFDNSNMTYPFYVKVPKKNFFVLTDFLNCLSDSVLIVQPEIIDLYNETLADGWHVAQGPTSLPTEDFTGETEAFETEELTETPSLSPGATPAETPKFSEPLQTPTSTESPMQTAAKTPGPSSSAFVPDQTAAPTYGPTVTEHVDIVREGDVFTTTESTQSLLIEGVASINIESLQNLKFSSYNSSSESSQINLFGRGIEQDESDVQHHEEDVELTVKDFNKVTVNIFNSKRGQMHDSVISLPIVVSEVADFEINNGYGQNQNESEITIKEIKAPTKTSDFTSHVSSNSQLNVKYITFSNDGIEKRLHQKVTSHSKFASNVDSITINKNIEAEMVNFTVKDKISLNQRSNLKLKQTHVDYHTVIEFNVDSLEEIGQIQIENSKLLNSDFFTTYLFSPNKIKLKMLNNSDSDRKLSLIKGISEDNCKQMFVSFVPQTNMQGNPYKSSCEDDQLFITSEPTPISTKKSNKINNGIIAAIVVGIIALIASIAAVIYLTAKEPRRIKIDESDAFNVSMNSINNDRIYN